MKPSHASLNSANHSVKRHAGPNLLLLALVYTGFMLAGGSKLIAAFRFPHGAPERSIAYLAENGWAIQWGSFCELASAIPLGIFAVTTVSRLRFLRVRAAGESIALLGGIGVTVMLILSALASWSLTRPGIADTSGAVPALQAISFAGGGPGFAVLLGLFIAGVSLTAGLHRLIPRWLMGLGIVVAIACELASLSLLNFKAAYFIPVGRFVSIVWMIGVALTLPTSITYPIAATDTNPAP
jgi:hypothetical protein